MAQAHRARLVSRRRVLVAAAAGLPLFGGGGLAWWRWGMAAGSPAASHATSGVRRRETRPTLDPALFTGKPAVAHRVAREIPDVLDQLRCYCGCDRHAGHVSLLSCYVDRHAVT